MNATLSRLYGEQPHLRDMPIPVDCEQLFSAAWRSGLRSGLPWGVLADAMDEHGLDGTLARVVMNFNWDAVDWDCEGVSFHDIDWTTPHARLVAVLMLEAIVGRYEIGGLHRKAVAGARAMGLRISLGLPYDSAAADHAAYHAARTTSAADAAWYAASSAAWSINGMIEAMLR